MQAHAGDDDEAAEQFSPKIAFSKFIEPNSSSFKFFGSFEVPDSASDTNVSVRVTKPTISLNSTASTLGPPPNAERPRCIAAAGSE